MGSVQGDRAFEETAGSVECDTTITTSKPVIFRYYSRLKKSTVVAVEVKPKENHGGGRKREKISSSQKEEKGCFVKKEKKKKPAGTGSSSSSSCTRKSKGSDAGKSKHKTIHQIVPKITLPVQLQTTGIKVKKMEENCELPWDVLDIIFKTLDFDDFFQFVGVCKNWRDFYKIYWRNFLASQEPLIVQISFHVKKSFSFISISHQKVYHLEMMDYFRRFSYSTSSSGYFINAEYKNSLSLSNPFTGIKKVINTPTFEVSFTCLAYHGLLAFDKCSEEFVLVVLCYNSLHVYQSRNCSWVTYTTKGNPWMVVDFVVLHNMIYVVTDKANIGVLNLNSSNIKFLKLKSTPNVPFSMCPRLVNCDEQLLVVDSRLNVYKIDFSTMNYVKLETLGDIALFNVSNTKCYALSNPKRWGYESNFVYVISSSSTLCTVYSGDDKKLQKCIMLPAPHGARSAMLDWCFRHLRYEVDFSLVE